MKKMLIINRKKLLYNNIIKLKIIRFFKKI